MLFPAFISTDRLHGNKSKRERRKEKENEEAFGLIVGIFLIGFTILFLSTL